MRKKIISFFLCFLFTPVLISFAPLLFADESITITTYYPSPYGSYNQLYVADKLGIGTTSPGVALEVAGQVKITGGSPGANKVLTSDANGLASWQTAGGGTPDYDSGWFADNNAIHATTLTHAFGSIPSNWSILFSTTNPPSGYVYPVREFNYAWYPSVWSGPSLRMTTTQFQLLWYSSANMLYWYDPVAGTWSAWTTGYIRVRLWK